MDRKHFGVIGVGTWGEVHVRTPVKSDPGDEAAAAGHLVDGADAAHVERADVDRHPQFEPDVADLCRILHVEVPLDQPVTIVAEGRGGRVRRPDEGRVGGVRPEVMGIGPVAAVPRVLQRTGMSLADIDVIELNEAFAAQSVAVIQELGIDEEKTNVNGGAIALGHPLGATGAKLMTTLLHELERTGGRYGLQTMCEGGGQANVTIIERLD